MKFGDNLRKLRKSNNISQEVLAEKVKVSRQSVSKWETGDAYPEMNNILELCKIFKCHINDLVNDSIIDMDSLDEDVKMSVVKFKSAKQKKVKALSKIMSVVARIGKVMCIISICAIVIAMIVLPTIISKIEVVDNQIVVNGSDKFTVIEKTDGVLEFRINDKLVADNKNVDSALKFKEVLSNNSKAMIITYSETSFVFMIISMVLMIYLFKHMDKLFTNINKGDTPFTLENVSHIKKMTYFMIALIIIPNITGALFEIVMQTDLNVEFELFDIIQILFLYIISYIFEYGYEIQLDSNGKMYGDENE